MRINIKQYILNITRLTSDSEALQVLLSHRLSHFTDHTLFTYCMYLYTVSGIYDTMRSKPPSLPTKPSSLSEGCLPTGSRLRRWQHHILKPIYLPMAHGLCGVRNICTLALDIYLHRIYRCPLEYIACGCGRSIATLIQSLDACPVSTVRRQGRLDDVSNPQLTEATPTCF